MSYKIGVVEAITLNELGKEAVNHVGLGLPDDENVGKFVQFKNPKYPAEKGIFLIVARQKCWGYDENGKYTLVDGYRGVSPTNKFGKPFTLDKVEFVNRKEDIK